MKQMTTKGFTLIELMITVAILGILLTVAVPQYGAYVQNSSRTDATAALLRMAAQQEQFVLRNNAGSYTTDVSLIGGEDTERGYYRLSVKSASATGFELQADAVLTGPQANDTGCTTLNITNANVKTPPECWVR